MDRQKWDITTYFWSKCPETLAWHFLLCINSTWLLRSCKSKPTTAPWTGGVWDLSSTRCSMGWWVHLNFIYLVLCLPPSEKKWLEKLMRCGFLWFHYSPRFIAATRQRCTTTSCTRLQCSNPTFQTPAGSCSRGSCRRTAPRGLAWRTIL